MSQQNLTPIHAIATELVGSGLSVVPIKPDGSKQPAIESWRELMTRLPNDNELSRWFSNRHRGIAVVGGAVSGGLECVDFDEVGLFERWADDLDQLSPELLRKLVIVKTPSGGAHAWIRSSAAQGNQILARRLPTEAESARSPSLKFVTMIETRGEGGYALVPGSPKECHPALRTYDYSPLGMSHLRMVATVSLEERELLLNLSRSFNTYRDPKNTKPQQRSDGNTPGDDFEQSGPSWQLMLEEQGWHLFRGDWERGLLTRPGKSKGVSATVGVIRGDKSEPLFHVFSSSAGIEPGTYGKFRAYAEFQHRGNLSEAAKALAQLGYGSKPTSRTSTSTTASNPNGVVHPVELVTRKLAGRKAKPVKWLVERKIPAGKLTTIAGVGGMGKSTLVRHLIACLTTGRAAFGLSYKPPPPVDVLLASVEDSPEDTIVPHLIAEAADLTRVHTVEGTRKADGGISPFDVRDIDLMVETVEKNSSIRLLVIDPIMSFIGRAGINENSSSEVRTILDPLIALADRTGVSVLLIAHLNKQTTATASNRIVGSTAFRDACRVVYAVGQHPRDDQQRVMAVVKENVPGLDTRSTGFSRRPLVGEELEMVLSCPEFADLSAEDRTRMSEQLAVVEPSGWVDVDADSALGGSRSFSNQPDSCADWLVERLGTEFAWLDSVIEAEAILKGFSSRQYRRAKMSLKKRGLNASPPGFGRGWVVGFGNPKTMPLGTPPSTNTATESSEEPSDADRSDLDRFFN